MMTNRTVKRATYERHILRSAEPDASAEGYFRRCGPR
jgi:hypothetical protein